MERFTIKHDEELERAFGKWVLVRRSLGVSSFGLNAVELPPGESIPEHDETNRGHEEVFLVLDGEATIVVDGVDHLLRAGPWLASPPSLGGPCATTAPRSPGCSSSPRRSSRVPADGAGRRRAGRAVDTEARPRCLPADVGHLDVWQLAVCSLRSSK